MTVVALSAPAYADGCDCVAAEPEAGPFSRTVVGEVCGFARPEIRTLYVLEEAGDDVLSLGATRGIVKDRLPPRLSPGAVEGTGSTFWFELPAVQQPRAAG